MSRGTHMSATDLDALLKRMPEMANAVNAFSSERIQQEAFAALIDAYGGMSPRFEKQKMPDDPITDATVYPDTAPIMNEPKDGVAAKPSVGKVKQPRKSNGASGSSFRLVKDLDLRPSGKASFEQFIADKSPSSNQDKYAVAVYWLQHIAEVPAVSWHHVATVYRLGPWREPDDVKAGLRVTASRKATIDTSNMDDIKTTPQGRNFVEHDLPAPAKDKK